MALAETEKQKTTECTTVDVLTVTITRQVVLRATRRDAMHKLGLCRRAVSVCHVTFVHCVQTAKDGHSCYRMRIGNRTRAFKWYHFQ